MNRWLALAAWLGAVVLAAFFWSTDRLSNSDNRVENELAQNGLSSFVRAALTSEIDYRANYASADPSANLALVAGNLERGGGRFTRLADGRIDRAFPARPGGLGKLNVILVSSESFGAEFSRLYGGKRDLTPNFDRFAQQGLWFRHAYASGTRTVRGLEAFAASIPPIPTVSILRRPGFENVATWGAVMRALGYHTSFLYGGYGYFDNMNAFFGDNGFEVLDRRSIDKVRFENIWGVADEDLFDHSLDYYDRQHAEGKPFFSIIMTTSNHKPFTFRAGLEAEGIPPEGGGRAAGVRYADFALGKFLHDAQGHAWFDDTLFVVAADHGARVYGAEDIPLRTYEIPLMIWSPKHVAPQRVDALMTQIDIAPTVLGLLGLPYEAPFFGQDALRAPAEGRVAFFNHNHDVAIYRDGRLVVFGLGKKVETYNYDPGSDRYTPAPADPELERLGVAYYQTAYELFEGRRYLPSDTVGQVADSSPGGP
jgi:phosphoglycerol transferase MdoB-like AlkP superfamily enzyme